MYHGDGPMSWQATEDSLNPCIAGECTCVESRCYPTDARGRCAAPEKHWRVRGRAGLRRRTVCMHPGWDMSPTRGPSNA